MVDYEIWGPFYAHIYAGEQRIGYSSSGADPSDKDRSDVDIACEAKDVKSISLNVLPNGGARTSRVFRDILGLRPVEVLSSLSASSRYGPLWE